MICSDGVYDNLDPQQLNVPCRDIGIDADEWEQGTCPSPLIFANAGWHCVVSVCVCCVLRVREPTAHVLCVVCAAKTEDAERAKDEYRCKFISDRLIASESDSENESDDGSSSSSDGEDESDSDDSDKKKKEKKKKKSKKENNKSKVQFVPLEQFATVLLEHAYEVGLPPLFSTASWLRSFSPFSPPPPQVTEYSRKWMEEHPTARMPDARYLAHHACAVCCCVCRVRCAPVLTCVALVVTGRRRGTPSSWARWITPPACWSGWASPSKNRGSTL